MKDKKLEPLDATEVGFLKLLEVFPVGIPFSSGDPDGHPWTLFSCTVSREDTTLVPMATVRSDVYLGLILRGFLEQVDYTRLKYTGYKLTFRGRVALAKACLYHT